MVKNLDKALAQVFPCLYEQIVRPWSLVNTPLERGVFGYQISYLQLPELTFYLEQFDLRCRVRGTSPKDTLVFAVPVRLGKHSSYWKSPVSKSGFPAMLQGGLDAEMDKGQAQLLVLIKRSLLRSYFPAEFYTKLEQAATMHLLPATLMEVRRLGEWLLALIRQANLQPDFLHYPATVQTVKEDLLQQLKKVIHVSAKSQTRPTFSKRRQGLERALEYLQINNRFEVSIPQLSEAAGVSQRTLEYAFRETFDLTVLNYLRLRRFHNVRHQLSCCYLHQ